MTALDTSTAAAAVPPGLWPRLRDYFYANPAATRAAIVIGAIAAWEIIGHTLVDPDFLAPPSAILEAAPRVFARPGVPAALWATFYELVVGFGIAVVLGVLIAVPIGLSRFAQRSTLPIVLMIYSVPQVTILPLFVLWFGVGAASKIAFGVSHGIFPIILNVVAGVQTVERAHITAAHSMGATRFQIFRRVVLPHMTPSLFSGLRLAMSGTLLGVLLAELYVSAGGLGYFTRLYSESFDPPATFTLVMSLALMAIFLNETVRRAEKRASFWRNERH
jgi:NitT/TauT family transport system permease protein